MTHPKRQIPLASASLLCLALQAGAATRTWDGGGANDFWTTAANWSLDTAPLPGDDLEFAGDTPLVSTNDYAAGFEFGSVTFFAPGYVVRGNALALTNGITLLGTIGPIEFFPNVMLLADQRFAVSRLNAALNLHGTLDLNGRTPRIFAAGTVNLLNTVSGAGGLIQDGGTLVLHSNNTFSGTATLNFGACLVLASNANINVTINSAASFGGMGLVRRISSVGGTLQPGGDAAGTLRVVASTVLDAATTFAVQLDGPASAQYDRLSTASASLGGATLALSIGYPMLAGEQFTILESTGGGAVTGTFGGLPEGALFIADNMQFQISYAGGDGNDVVLTAVAQQPSGVTRTWDGGGANNLWTTPANWVGDVAPNPGDELVFPAGAAQLSNVNDYPNGAAFDAIEITGAGYSISGNRVALIAATIVRASYAAGTSTLGLNIELLNHALVVNFVATMPHLILSGDIDLGGFNLSFVCEGPITVSGAVSGTGGIFKGKNPALRLTGSAANTFTGPTTILGLCELDKTPGINALVGPLNIGNEVAGPGEVRLLADEQISNSSTITVFTAASFNLNGFNETLHSLCLTGGVVNTLGGTLTLLGGVETKPSSTTANITGNLALSAGADHIFSIANGAAANDLDVSAVLSGPADAILVKTGAGQMRYSGNMANTLSGEARVHAGTLLLAKAANTLAVAGPLVIGDGVGAPGSVEVRYGGNHQIADTSPVTLNSDAVMTVQGWTDTIGSLSGVGAVDLATSQLTVGGDSADAAHSGVISGAGSITKIGPGTQAFSGNNTYAGNTTVSGGTLLVNGNQPSSTVVVQTGATLGGHGTTQRINVQSGGRLSPGGSPGVLTTAGFVTFQDSSSIFRVELNGLTPGAGHDQLNTPFAVGLANATLQVSLGFIPAVSNSFVIVNKGGVAPVTGTFNGLPEGATFPSDGLLFAITYLGGDGNDVVLTRVPAPTSQLTGIMPARGGIMKLAGLGLPGLLYTLEAATNLNAPIFWTPLGAATADATGAYQFIDVDAPFHPMRFYRTRSP
jgi:autotransporter-associated beta strand protein